MVVIARHQQVLQSFKIATLDQVRKFKGNLVKNHRGHRDIFRIETRDETGRSLTLFLKRNLKPYKKDGLASLLRRGRVWSSSRQEWEHSRVLARAGFDTAPLVAWGEDCGLLWERYSYLITEAAPGAHSLDGFAKQCRDRSVRVKVLLALATWVRRLHDAGLASPDLFARHIFVKNPRTNPDFCLIDMARLDRRRRLSLGFRARDLSALNVTLAKENVSAKERILFLKTYDAESFGRLHLLVVQRMDHLLKKRRFRRAYCQER